MKIFGVQSDGDFREYSETPFQTDHNEAVLEDWLAENPDGILEDSRLLIVGRQVVTNLGSVIDLLGVDRQGNLVVLELKRDRTPRETIAQALEYVSFAERLDSAQLDAILCSYLSDESVSVAEYHHEYFGLSADETVSFNKDQRIVVVGQQVTPEIRQTASFLRSKGIGVTCVEFTFFEAEGGTRLLSQEIVVGKEPMSSRRVSGRVASGSLPFVTEEEFIASLDENGRPVFVGILEYARQKAMPIHWAAKGFSLNVDLDGTHAPICYGFPPQSSWKQSLYTAFGGGGGLTFKTAIPEEVVQDLKGKAAATNLFRPASRELKCLIDRRLSDKEIADLLAWCDAVSEAIKQYGLKE